LCGSAEINFQLARHDGTVDIPLKGGVEKTLKERFGDELKSIKASPSTHAAGGNPYCHF
jgi:hypothetical protein